MGRLAKHIDEELALKMASEGDTISSICEALGVAWGTLSNYIRKPSNSTFHQKWLEARSDGLELRADGLLTAADDESVDVNRLRIRSDNVKWLLSRRLPGQYGDRMAIDANVSIDIAGALAAARGRLRPISDQSDVEDAQVIDTKQITDGSTTVNTTVDTEITPAEIVRGSIFD